MAIGSQALRWKERGEGGGPTSPAHAGTGLPPSIFALRAANPRKAALDRSRIAGRREGEHGINGGLGPGTAATVRPSTVGVLPLQQLGNRRHLRLSVVEATRGPVAPTSAHAAGKTPGGGTLATTVAMPASSIGDARSARCAPAYATCSPRLEGWRSDYSR